MTLAEKIKKKAEDLRKAAVRNIAESDTLLVLAESVSAMTWQEAISKHFNTTDFREQLASMMLSNAKGGSYVQQSTFIPDNPIVAPASPRG